MSISVRLVPRRPRPVDSMHRVVRPYQHPPTAASTDKRATRALHRVALLGIVPLLAEFHRRNHNAESQIGFLPGGHQSDILNEKARHLGLNLFSGVPMKLFNKYYVVCFGT